MIKKLKLVINIALVNGSLKEKVDTLEELIEIISKIMWIIVL